MNFGQNRNYWASKKPILFVWFNRTTLYVWHGALILINTDAEP